MRSYQILSFFHNVYGRRRIWKHAEDMLSCRDVLKYAKRYTHVYVYALEVATPTPRPFSDRGCHALTWRSHGHSVVGCMPTCDVISARQWSYPVSALSGVLLPGKGTTEMTSQS